MSETHPNAFLAEAGAKRQRALQLLSEADALEAKVPAELRPKPAKKPAKK